MSACPGLVVTFTKKQHSERFWGDHDSGAANSQKVYLIYIYIYICVILYLHRFLSIFMSGYPMEGNIKICCWHQICATDHSYYRMMKPLRGHRKLLTRKSVTLSNLGIPMNRLYSTYIKWKMFTYTILYYTVLFSRRSVTVTQRSIHIIIYIVYKFYMSCM